MLKMAYARNLGERVRLTLAAEQARRRPGVTDGLCDDKSLLEVLPLRQIADGSIAVLAPKCEFSRLEPGLYRAAAQNKIWQFLGPGPSLPRGFVVAGGAPACILTSRRVIHDIDVFLVGLDREQGIAFVRNFGSGLTRRLRCFGQFVLRVYRTVRCVTFVAATAEGQLITKIQIILRLYSSVSEVLHGFDLGSSKVADDGQRLYFTEEGRLAFECGLNVVNPAVRRASYERRIQKYWKRGFGLAMPDFAEPLSLLSLRRVEVLELPFLNIYDAELSAEKRILQARRLGLPRPGDHAGRPPAAPALPEGPPRADSVRINYSKLSEGYEYEDLEFDQAFSALRHDMLARQNMLAARLGRTAALCAAAVFSSELDVTVISPQVDDYASLLVGAVEEFRFRRLAAALLPNPRARDCLQSALRSLDGAGFDRSQLIEIVRKAADKYRPQLSIPFELAGLKETAFELSEVNGRVAPAVWYGEFFAATEAARADVWRTLRDLTDVGLATLAVEYMGTPFPGTRCGICPALGRLYGSGAEDLWCLGCGSGHLRFQACKGLLVILPAGQEGAPKPGPDKKRAPPPTPLRAKPGGEDRKEKPGPRSDRPGLASDGATVPGDDVGSDPDETGAADLEPAPETFSDEG